MRHLVVKCEKLTGFSVLVLAHFVFVVSYLTTISVARQLAPNRWMMDE
jgi:hypothetical protein